MTNYLTQGERVIARMDEVGYCDNLWAIENHILRLAAVIADLKRKGYEFTGKFGSNEHAKIFYYYLLRKPTDPRKMVDATLVLKLSNKSDPSDHWWYITGNSHESLLYHRVHKDISCSCQDFRFHQECKHSEMLRKKLATPVIDPNQGMLI